jgi:hypothetical protein
MDTLFFTLLAKPWIPLAVLLAWIGGCLALAAFAERGLYELEEDR